MNFLKNTLLIIILVLAGCKSQQGNQSVSEEQLVNKIETKLGENPILINNFDASFVLAYREDKSSGTLVIRFGVWVISTGELIYAGTAMRGKVEWLDNESLLVEDYPGIVDENNPVAKFKIDLKTKIKTPLHEKKDL